MTSDTEEDDASFVGRYDWAETPPNMAIVDAVATASGRDPGELEPLYEFVDPDALEAFVEQQDGSASQLSFTYGSWRVTARSDGTVFIREWD